MVEIPWPLTNAPGAEAQEGAGKLTNMFVERRGDDQAIVWRRAPGAKVFVVDPTSGTIAGSAELLATSSVVNASAAIAGSSLISSVSGTLTTRTAAGALDGSANIASVTERIVDADGSIDGSAALSGISE